MLIQRDLFWAGQSSNRRHQLEIHVYFLVLEVLLIEMHAPIIRGNRTPPSNQTLFRCHQAIRLRNESAQQVRQCRNRLPSGRGEYNCRCHSCIRGGRYHRRVLQGHQPSEVLSR